MRLKAKIIILTLIVMGMIFVLWTRGVPFLSSSIVQASLWVPETSGDMLVNIRFEREQLSLDKKEKTEEKSVLEKTIHQLQEKKQTIKSELQLLQKKLDDTNASIVAFPWPDMTNVEKVYAQKIAEENARYEKQKRADQKLYTDTINLINQTYEETMHLNKGKEGLVTEDVESLAVTNRKNALQSLTNAQIEHLEKHEEKIQSLEEERQQNIEKAQVENNALLLPIIQKKENLVQEKNNKQAELESVMAGESQSMVELEKITQSLEMLEHDLSGLDYKILMLEEDILRTIIPEGHSVQ